MPRLNTTATKTLIASSAAGEPIAETAAVTDTDLVSEAYQLKLIEKKPEQLIYNAAAIQQIHIISSDEEGDDGAAMSVISNSGSDDSHEEFAGFPSPGTTNTNNAVAAPIVARSNHNLQKRSTKLQKLPGANSELISQGKFGNTLIDLRKRNSLQTAQGEASNVTNLDELELTQITPVKRKREPTNVVGNASETPLAVGNNEINLQTPPPSQPCQIVEVNSNSTTHSLKQKRLQRKSGQNLYINTKCSTESSSEFPVSSPSNPQQPGCSKFLQRPPLLKNTLPADSFERHLALITTRNPQMTLDDKMSSWQCDLELSDVEDVNTFDDRFQRCEENKRKTLKSTKNKQANATELKENYDFTHFRNVILKNLRSKTMLSAQDQSDRPSTSAGALASASNTNAAGTTQRRIKAAHGGGDGPEKKRLPIKKNKTQSSTTPPPASSSSTSLSSVYTDADDNNVQSSHPHHPLKKSQLPRNVSKVLVYEKILCPSSSDASQGSKHEIERATTSKNKLNSKAFEKSQVIDKILPESKNITTKLQKAHQTLQSIEATEQINTPPLNLHWTSEEDSVFRLNRLNREIDKSKLVPAAVSSKYDSNFKESKPGGIIQMRLDFLNDKKELKLKEKMVEIFKTPTVPQKYQTPSPINHINSIVPIVNNALGSSTSPKSSLSLKSAEEIQVRVLPADAAVSGPAQHVFHQQHEFCNYLGLTGMSTANAVANAVAELAKCNLARRSLRVRRLQHEQEKHSKDIKERKQLEELKAKQLRELKRHENSKCSSLESNNEGQHNITNIEMKTQVPSLEDTKKESEIKIICRIEAEKNKHVQKIKKSYVKQLTAPIRKTLMQHLKRVRKSFDTSTLPRSSRSEAEEAEEAGEDSGSNNLQILDDLKNVKCNESLSQSKITVTQENQSTQSTCSSSRISRNNEQEPLQNITEDNDNNIKKPTTSHSEQIQKLHLKFQEYLEQSRRAKPSIFIVHSIDNDKDNKKEHGTNNEKVLQTLREKDSVEKLINEGPVKPITIKPTTEVVKDKLKMQHRVLNTRKEKSKLHKLLTRSVLNMSQQRQLRNRKIVILKTTVKRDPLGIRKSTKQYKNFATKKSENYIIQKSVTIPADASEKKPSAIMSNNDNDTKTLIKVPPNVPLNPNRIKSPSRKHVQDETILHKYVPLPKTLKQHLPIEENQAEVIYQPTAKCKVTENDIVVVSSTTNCYDETKEISTTYGIGRADGGDGGRGGSVFVDTNKFALKKDSYFTKDAASQSISNVICFLSTASSLLANPLKSENGKVLHIYYELDILIVVQEVLVSFWKYSKLLNVINIVPQQQTHMHLKQHTQQQQNPRVVESTSNSLDALAEGLHLGECKRLINDIEISCPYSNRLCVHNSLPIYIEMRCRELQKERRDCNLLSLYINIYYYNDEDMQAKMHSIQLDSVQSLPKSVIYTTITDSRYFVMSWPQENMLGKKRSGLCKYSLTPHLDTLASIREFKSLRHEICYLECTDDDKLLGFGASQLTIWDHRSGDVLMNYDLDIHLGQNLGSVFYPSLEIGQNNIIILFQFLKSNQQNARDDINSQTNLNENTSLLTSGSAEVHVIACSISHATPSYRLLYKHALPSPTFNEYKNAINTGEHLIITAHNDEEIWLSCGDPRMITLVPAQCSQRFYTRGRSQLIELTERSLTIDCFANHVLKIAAYAAALK